MENTESYQDFTMKNEIRGCGCSLASFDNIIEKNDEIGEENVIDELDKMDVDCMIRLLMEIVSHCEFENDVARICQILTSYLREVEKEGYPLKHLLAVTQILEFLTWRIKDIADYRILLNRMLNLCDRPPILKRTSDSFVSLDIMEQYFTMLGYLLVISPNKREFLILQAALNRLLVRTKPVNKAALKIEFCIRAVERSRLPVTVAELLDASLPDMYPILLEFVHLLASISDICCYRMVEAGILNTLLIRMDLAYATQAWCTPPPDVPLEGEEYSEDTMVLIMDVLWRLLTSILPSKELPHHLRSLRAPVQCATWGLRYAFKRQIYTSKGSCSSIKLRNSIAMFILVGLVALPSWNLVGSGIADDVISYLSAAESGTIKVWSTDIKFYYSNEDLFFMKTLLMIVSYLVNVDACIFIMAKENVINTVLELVDPDTRTFRPSRRSTQYWDLSGHPWYALSRLLPKMPKEFIKNNGASRLIAIIRCSMKSGIDAEFMINWTRTICSIVTHCHTLLLDNLREHNMMSTVIDLINNLLGSEKFSMQYQRILTLALIIMEKLFHDQTYLRGIFGKTIVDIAINIIDKSLYQENCCDVEVDQRLLIALGALIWECIVWCPENLENFLGKGGMYMLLDTVEIGMFQVQCLFLGVILDICDTTFCGPYLWTWRGADKSKGLMSLLARIWREEEIRLGIKRNSDGTVEDAELPQMGLEQWHATYHAKLKYHSSPSIEDMAGSARSKIYGIRKIIEREKERNEMTKYRYKVLLDDVPLEDRITMCCADLYFRLKRGEIWTELEKYFEQVGVTPLSMDGQIMFLMMQRHRAWGMFIKERQRKLILAAEEKEKIEEKDELASIRNSKLASSLEALWEINYIRRTTDQWHRVEKKCEQRMEVNAALNFPFKADVNHCHRTFQDNINVTAVFDQHFTIRTGNITDLDAKMKVSPVSPESSEENFNADYVSVTSLSTVTAQHSSLKKLKPSKKHKATKKKGKILNCI